MSLPKSSAVQSRGSENAINCAHFGTLCAVDPEPYEVNRPEIGTFTFLAEIIAFHLDTHRKLARAEETILLEQEASELREQFIAVLGHDLRNPLASIRAGTELLLRHPERWVVISETCVVRTRAVLGQEGIYRGG